MLTVIKIGGNVINDPQGLDAFLRRFAAMPGQKVLVHGGGREATALARRMGVETQLIDGRRVTSAEMIDLCTMVYAGLLNKRIVARLQTLDCDAVGLSGADGHAIVATRRPPVPVDYGFVGDIDPADVNAPFLKDLVDGGLTPVMNAITLGKDGSLLNCNADTIAQSVAVAMAGVMPTRLVYVLELPGVLRDINDPATVIPTIDSESFVTLREEGIIADGMVPKISNALQAVAAGVRSVTIRGPQSPDGTTITN